MSTGVAEFVVYYGQLPGRYRIGVFGGAHKSQDHLSMTGIKVTEYT
jgi:hypothetical protein